MEIDGHPTQDLIEELQHRGALRLDGTAAGPNVEALRFATEQVGDEPGFWLFLPRGTYMTGFDDYPD